MKQPISKAEPGDEADASARTLREDSNALLGAGFGIAAIGALGGLVAGTVCPVCIVATPALIGAGVVQRVRAVRRRRSNARSSPDAHDESTRPARQAPAATR